MNGEVKLRDGEGHDHDDEEILKSLAPVTCSILFVKFATVCIAVV